MTDMMFKDEIQELVRDAYGRIEPPDGAGARFYQEDQLERVPPTARRWSLGVGNPLLWADLHPGERVVDLGSGAGIDVFLAAARVGPTGTAVGIDLLDSMVERSREAAEEAGVENVEFIRSEMENLPLDDKSVDVVISNGSINLSARKSRVLAEAFRVLRPGGRVCVTDLILNDEDLPPEIVTHPAAWAG